MAGAAAKEFDQVFTTGDKCPVLGCYTGWRGRVQDRNRVDFLVIFQRIVAVRSTSNNKQGHCKRSQSDLHVTTLVGQIHYDFAPKSVVATYRKPHISQT